MEGEPLEYIKERRTLVKNYFRRSSIASLLAAILGGALGLYAANETVPELVEPEPVPIIATYDAASRLTYKQQTFLDSIEPLAEEEKTRVNGVRKETEVSNANLDLYLEEITERALREKKQYEEKKEQYDDKTNSQGLKVIGSGILCYVLGAFGAMMLSSRRFTRKSQELKEKYGVVDDE